MNEIEIVVRAMIQGIDINVITCELPRMSALRDLSSHTIVHGSNAHSDIFN
jgi:hypothetical protein